MNEAEEERGSVVDWRDPRAVAEAGRGLSGLEHLRRIAAGELPPPSFSALLDFKFAELEEGRVVFTAAPAAQHYNLIGTVHGGYTATLLDSAMGCAVLSMLPTGVGWTTLELKINYVRPLTIESGTVRCEGATLHVGRKVALAEGRVTNAAGKLLAHGTTTCLIFHP